jgi:hypothetical protein
VVVFALAYATAFGETLTIAHFPYYTFKVRGRPALQETSSSQCRNPTACTSPVLLLPQILPLLPLLLVLAEVRCPTA